MDKISTLCLNFTQFSCRHIFRERNRDADGLSKEGLLLDKGLWHVT